MYLMIILGIDPGTHRTGFAVIEKERSRISLLECGLISPKTQEQRQRILIIWQKTEELIEKYKPNYIAIEKIFFSQNQKTALAVAEVRGIFLLKSAMQGAELLEFSPNEVKLTICGYGHASKSQVLNIVLKTLKIDKIDGPDDVSDAVAIALTGAFRTRSLMAKN